MPKILKRLPIKPISIEAVESIQPITEYIAELEARIRLELSRKEYKAEALAISRAKVIQPILLRGQHVRLIHSTTCDNCGSVAKSFSSFAIVQKNSSVSAVQYKPEQWSNSLIESSTAYCLGCTGGYCV